MAKQSWRTGIALGCAVLGLTTVWGGRAQAQGYGTAVIDTGAECEADDCESPRCCRGMSFCNKLRMHAIYHSRKSCRTYRRLDYTPAELAPYIGPGTYYSPGYGVPHGSAPCPPGGYGYGSPAAAQMGYAR